MDAETREAIVTHRQRAEWDAVIELANQVLESEPGDIQALQTLSEAHAKLGQDEEVIRCLATLVDRHHEVSPYARKLGLMLKKRGEPAAKDYLEKALIASINRKDTGEIEEVWLELVDLGNTPATAFLEHARKLASRKEGPLAGDLLTLFHDGTELSPREKLEVLQAIVGYLPEKQGSLRNSLIEAYQAAFGDRPDIDRLVGLSGIATSESVIEAITQLDRFLKFGEGQFFYHNGWGVGKVTRIEPSQQRIFLDFERKTNHVVTLEMADKSLLPIPDHDIRAMLFEDPQGVARKAREEPVEIVKSALVSLGGKATGKEIKSALLDCVIPESEWQKWWTGVNKHLKDDHFIEVTGTSLKTYELREAPEGPDEEYGRRFRESKTLKGKLDLFKAYSDQRGDKCKPEILSQMAEDLLSRSSLSKAEGTVVETIFAIRDLADRLDINQDRTEDLLQPILHNLGRAVDALEGLKGASLQKRWFSLMEEALKEELSQAYEKLMHDGPDNIRDLVAEHVSKTHEEDVLSRLFRQVRPQIREEPGLFIWYAKELLEARAKAEAEAVTRPGLIENLISLHEVLSYRAKTGPKEQAADLRSHMSDIRALLKRGSFKRLREIMKETDRTTARELWKSVEGAAGIEDRIRKEITGYILAHFPNVASGVDDSGEGRPEPAVAFPSRLLCLLESYQFKTRHQLRLKTVDIPENTLEVETARLMGDLRENAEYHAAKEKQGVLLTLSAQLEQEIASASVIPVEEFAQDYVGFGSKVRIRQETGEREVTLLGPWESKPESNILSYLSPMGRAIWGYRPGDSAEVDMGDRVVPVEIVKVEPLTEVPAVLLESTKQG